MSTNAPTSKKRKTSSGDEPSGTPTALSTMPCSANPPKYVYIVMSLCGGPGEDESERSVESVHSQLSIANAVALDDYNLNREGQEMSRAWIQKSDPEDEDIEDNGVYRETIPVGGHIPKNELEASYTVYRPHHRKDGGMRFGGQNVFGELWVVWVERRLLDPPLPLQCAESDGTTGSSPAGVETTPEGDVCISA
ncbi:hypothetical protein BDV97DRAFT_366726 [Delphinella strobiligena]|nr:hypothetical protein BDV97DRAFT_366726 [Delphinella strobiligena]